MQLHIPVEPPGPPVDSSRHGGRHKLAIVVFTLTGPILALDYWSNGGRITGIGDVPLLTLFVIATIGGVISFLLFANGRERWFAAPTGAIAGFGAFGLHILYTNWADPDTMHDGGSAMLAILGAAPGIFLFWLFSRMVNPKKPASLVDAVKRSGNLPS